MPRDKKHPDRKQAEEAPIGHPDGDIPIGDDKSRQKLWPRLPILHETFQVYMVRIQESSPPTAQITSDAKSESSSVDVVTPRTFSVPFTSVYPERADKVETIGTNPVKGLSFYHKSRLRLASPDFEEEEIEESDLIYFRRRVREIYMSYIIVPAVSCILCCRGICRENIEVEELKLLFQPRTHHGVPYLQELKASLSIMPEKQWRRIVHKVLTDTVDNAISATNHIGTLIRFMNQLQEILAFSDLYSSEPIMPIKRERLKGRSMAAGFIYLITFTITHFDKTEERLHENVMAHLRKQFLELMREVVMLWTAICHMVATSEIILDELEHTIAKYLFHIRAITTLKLDMTARDDYKEQARIRLILRKEKKRKDGRNMVSKSRWTHGTEVPPLPNVEVVSRIEISNRQWHPLSLFHLEDQARVVENLFKRVENILADGFVLLTEFDRVLHNHRPNRTSSETETLFEDSIFLKDRFMELNTFPTSEVREGEVKQMYDVGRIISDCVDELYISIYAAKDFGRETAHMAQLCHEYLRAHEKWNMEPSHVMIRDIQEEFHQAWNHFPKFRGQEFLPAVEDPIPFFNASIYPALLRMFPAKVARLFVSFQTPEEIAARTSPSSHSLWDAFDTVDVNQYPKYDSPDLNKEEKVA